MARSRTPTLAAPLKAAKASTASFKAKICEHAAVAADPLLAQKASWTAEVLAEFEQLITQRVEEHG